MRPIHSLIDTKYLTKAHYIQNLTDSVRSRLSTNLRQHCWVADISGNCVTIITDQAEHATMLRYHQHELVKQINEEFTLSLTVPIRRMKVKVDYKLTNLTQPLSTNIHTGRGNTENSRKQCAKLLRLLNNS